ncbi:MAG: flagellar basal body L-ring protein FlgH [Bacillota bacterium]
MKKYYSLIVLVIIIVFISGSASANSLWDDSDSMYKDGGSFKKGDIVTVNITENSSANQEASTDLSQNNQGNVEAGTGVLDFLKSLGYEQSDSNSSSGNTSRSGSLSATMTVRVVKVLENGDLKISGTKEVNINGENQQIKLTGLVRPEDISSENTVDSNYLANVNIHYSGEGIVGDKQDPGILSRIFNWLF